MSELTGLIRFLITLAMAEGYVWTFLRLLTHHW
jgi:hypothetical protein